MANLVKNKRTKKLDPRVIGFWSIIAAITITLIIVLIVSFVKNLQETDKDDLEYLVGNEIFKCEEQEYFVIIYDFEVEDEEELDEFERVILNYQTFLKKHYGDKIDGIEYAHKLYAVDSADPDNYKAIVKDVKDSNYKGTSVVTDGFVDASQKLRIAESDLPTLLVIKDGVVQDASVTGVGEVCNYLQEIIEMYK